MTSVLLRLEGPLQAWGTQSKLGIRATDREPSKSGVLGLAAAALGMERHDSAMLARLRSLTLAVRVDRPGLLLRDYHTAGGGRFRGRDHVVFGAGCVPSHRYYLQDASFLAALSGEDALVDELARALQSPHWPLYLGRRACPPATPVFAGVTAAEAADATRSAPVAERTRGEALRILVEVTADRGGEPRYDVPLSFAEGDRRYGLRHVLTEWCNPPRAVTSASNSSPVEV